MTLDPAHQSMHISKSLMFFKVLKPCCSVLLWGALDITHHILLAHGIKYLFWDRTCIEVLIFKLRAALPIKRARLFGGKLFAISSLFHTRQISEPHIG